MKIFLPAKRFNIRPTVVLLAIMWALPASVKAQDKNLPSRNHGKSSQETTFRDAKSEIAGLVEFLLKNGTEFRFREHIAPVLGLPGPMPSKVSNATEEHRGDDRVFRLYYLVYENSSDPTAKDGTHPFCIYLRKRTVSGHANEDQYFRVNFDGQVEKAVVIRGKIDDEGKIVSGASVPTDLDIGSAESKKSFTAEMSQMILWLKKQKRLQDSPAVSTPAQTAP
jgi:hypothetical protein